MPRPFHPKRLFDWKVINRGRQLPKPPPPSPRKITREIHWPLQFQETVVQPPRYVITNGCGLLAEASGKKRAPAASPLCPQVQWQMITRMDTKGQFIHAKLRCTPGDRVDGHKPIKSVCAYYRLHVEESPRDDPRHVSEHGPFVFELAGRGYSALHTISGLEIARLMQRERPWRLKFYCIFYDADVKGCHDRHDPYLMVGVYGVEGADDEDAAEQQVAIATSGVRQAAQGRGANEDDENVASDQQEDEEAQVAPLGDPQDEEQADGKDDA